jgi:type IX secretion system substrate protein/NHL repeat-containing protein
MKKSLFILASALLLVYNVKAQIITTIAGNGTGGYLGDGGPATAAELHGAYGTRFDAAGNLYIGDALNNRIRKVNTNGVITTFAGTGVASFSGDGGAATAASFSRPTDIVIDAAGNIYISDEENYCIRKINTAGIISTYAGMGGMSGYSGDGGQATAAMLTNPSTISIDGHGNIYVSDYVNSVIRKVTPAGIISTIAGGGSGGDGGQATAASLNSPCKVAFDNAGNFYIADEYNQAVRKVNSIGIISTVAGNYSAGYSGDGGQATAASINYCEYIQVDGLGNLYIADKLNNVVRKVNTTGIITTIVGTSTAGYTGDGGPCLSATLDYPEAITFDVSGNMYVTDWYNNAIRKISNETTSISQVKNTAIEELSIYPNPSAGIVNIEFANVTENSTYKVYNTMGQEVKSGNLNQTVNQINLQDLNAGMYTILVSQQDIVSTSKIVVQK